MAATDQPVRFPAEVSILELIRSRNEELNAINNECKTKLPKLARQRLPRYMRRRAASHNPKRIPAAIRSKWLTTNVDASSESKEKRRKQMKKHINERSWKKSVARRNLSADHSFNHVWFAKRFKMDKLWDMYIGIHNATKNERNMVKMAKSGHCFFYLGSFLRCLEVKCRSSQDRNFFLSKLKNEVIHDAVDLQLVNNVERSVVLNDPSNPSRVIGAVTLIVSETELRIWCHVVIITLVENAIKQLIDGNVNHSISRLQLERYRICGPSSQQDITSMFSEQDATISDKERGQIVTATDVSKLLEDADKSKAGCVQLINTSAGTRQIVDIICDLQVAKPVWNKLVMNRSHLVGGLRDLITQSIYMSQLMFPFSGFIDSEHARSLDGKENNWLKQFTNRDQLTVIRRKSILDDIAAKKFDDSLVNCIVNVEVNCVSRGSPERGDLICLPSEFDLNELFKARDEFDIEPKYHPVELSPKSVSKDINCSIRAPIGCLELGCYNYDTGHGRGIGFVMYDKLRELVQVNANHANRQLTALLRSPRSATFRFVTVKVIT